VLLRFQDEESLRRSDTLGKAGFRGFEAPCAAGFIEGALMVSERWVRIHSSRGFRGTGRMAAYFMKFMVVSTLVLIGFGGFLLYDAVSQASNSQGLEVIGGAVLLALGLMTLYPQGQLVIRRLRETRAQSGRPPI
jgi:hypothetical protein